MIKRCFKSVFILLFTVKSFCDVSSPVTTGSFSPLQLSKNFKYESYLKQPVDAKLPSFSPLDVKEKLTDNIKRKEPYSQLAVLQWKIKRLPPAPSFNVFFSSTNDFREKYFFDVVFWSRVKKFNYNSFCLLYDGNVMFRYKECHLISFSSTRKYQSFFLSNIAVRIGFPSFLQGFFSARVKSFCVKKKNNKTVSSFVLNINKISFLKIVGSHDEYFRFLFRVEGVSSHTDYSSIVFYDSFFLSFKPEYVVEMSTKMKIIGKVNFILSKNKGDNWDKPFAYPGIDIEYKKNNKLVFFFKTNNGCSFYDEYRHFYDKVANKLYVTEGFSYDRLNMELGLSNIYSSSFKISLSLPFHWKQIVDGSASERFTLKKDFDFFFSPFFSFDLSLCRRKVFIFFKNNINLKIPRIKERLSVYIPINDLSLNISCRFRTKHTIFFSVRYEIFFHDVCNKHLFNLFFEYNWYLSDNFLFFIKLQNIERLLFDTILGGDCCGLLPKRYLAQDYDVLGDSRKKFYVAIGFKIPV